MDLYGLVGFPLGHSFSKRFFTEKFEREQPDAQYVNFEIPDICLLTDILKEHASLRGLNVTIPYKERVIPFLDDICPEAKDIGAVNVIRVTHTPEGVRLKGFNSDIIGFKKSLVPLLKPEHKRALVLGTGGASKAVVKGLMQLGIEPLYVSRTAAQGRIAYEDLDERVMQDCRVVVNCTPCGMFPHVNDCPQIPYHLITPQHVLYDLVYNPEVTEFMKRGRRQGATVKNGLEMLHLQALAAWEFWNSMD